MGEGAGGQWESEIVGVGGREKRSEAGRQGWREGEALQLREPGGGVWAYVQGGERRRSCVETAKETSRPTPVASAPSTCQTHVDQVEGERGRHVY